MVLHLFSPCLRVSVVTNKKPAEFCASAGLNPVFVLF